MTGVTRGDRTRAILAAVAKFADVSPSAPDQVVLFADVNVPDAAITLGHARDARKLLEEGNR